jgi:hypothetical protein
MSIDWFRVGPAERGVCMDWFAIAFYPVIAVAIASIVAALWFIIRH